jgi:hypothetical protein
MKQLMIYLISLAFLLPSCSKRNKPISWDADIAIPLAYGSLNIVDLLTDTLTTIQSNQSVYLNYSNKLFSLELDSLVKIDSPDLSDTFALPFPVAINFNPGQVFINQTEEQQIDLNNIEITAFDLEAATLNYTIKSTIIGEVIYEYQINSATDQMGNVFKHEVLVPAAQIGSPAIVTGTISLANYQWDLTGMNGNSTNKILTTMNVKVSENNTSPISVSNQDTLYIQNNLASFQLQSAKGYFGQDNITVGPDSSSIDLFNKITAGIIDISQLSANFELINGIGVDAQIQINQISVNDPLNNQLNLGHSIIGQNININRAFQSGNTITPSIFSTTFDQNNSNIVAMIEAMPNQMNYGMQLQINPLGNVSGHNDFVYKEHPFQVNLDLLMPLDLIANNLTLQDTIDININDTGAINYGSLYIEIDNGFPIEAQLLLSIENGNNDLLSPNTINAAAIDLNGSVVGSTISQHTLDLSSNDIEALKTNKKLILTIIFNTADPSNYITLYDFYELNFKISTQFNSTINIP